MEKRMKVIVATLVVVTCLTGCGQWGGLPEPTSKPVSKADVLGVWSWQASRPMKVNTSVSYTVTIEMKTDGAFVQEILVAGQTNAVKQSGTWTLDGSKIRFSDLLQEDFDFDAGVGKWKAYEATWWMTDTFDKKQPLALFGGLFGDPDSFQEFKKLR
jgi:hypothetical protein